MLLVIYIPQIMTVFLVGPWHLHLIFVTFCLSILNNSSKQKNRITTPTNWHSLTSFQTNLHHQYWITKVSPANCPAVMSKERLLYLQAAQHRHCDFSAFLTTWSDMQSDLPPSCKLDTDSAQPCLDNMFFLYYSSFSRFFVIVRMVLLQTVTSVTWMFFLLWFICVTFWYIHWTGKFINVLCCFLR